MKENPKDRRKHTRVELELDAELQISEGESYRGHTKDISFSGAYIYCTASSDIPEGKEGLFKLYLQTGPKASVINFKCSIVRTGDHGVGIKFISTDIDGYQQFKNLMTYNSSDPEKLVDELEKNPGLEIL